MNPALRNTNGEDNRIGRETARENSNERGD